MRCLSVLDLVILFYLFIFFLGREAQKVREWGVNSLKTSIFPLPTPLRGCRSLLIFPLPTKLKRSRIKLGYLPP